MIQLLEREAAIPVVKAPPALDQNALEIQTLVLLLNNLLGPNQDRWVIN